MTRTFAEALREEGAIRALQQALLDSMKTKFSRVPRQMEKAIRATRDENQLHSWLVQTVKAATVHGIGIVPPSQSSA